MYVLLPFSINNMYTFLHKKINFLSNSFFFFKICKMYTFDQYFWLKITNTLDNKTVDNCFLSTISAHFV